MISNRALREFARIFPDAGPPLQAWRKIVEASRFSGFADLKAGFRSVDKVDDFYVFNIGGNKYRLVVAIHFDRQLVFVRAVMTHSKYDKGRWKEQRR